MADEQPSLIAFTAQIVASYVDGNQVPADEVSGLIRSVHDALSRVLAPPVVDELAAPTPTAAQIRKSIKPDGLVSFEDGKTYKTLKRHLATRGLTPAAYRAKWGLPADYPMTAASYSAARAATAKAIGLGQLGGRRKKATATVAKPLRRK